MEVCMQYFAIVGWRSRQPYELGKCAVLLRAAIGHADSCEELAHTRIIRLKSELDRLEIQLSVLNQLGCLLSCQSAAAEGAVQHQVGHVLRMASGVRARSGPPARYPEQSEALSTGRIYDRFQVFGEAIERVFHVLPVG